MTSIKVDLDVLQDTVNSVNTFADAHNTLVDNMRTEANSLNEVWRGDDQLEFMYKWAELSNYDGSFTVAKNNIECYRDLLTYALNEYREAQRKAVEEAERIDWLA